MNPFLIVLFAIFLVTFSTFLLRLLYAGIPYEEWVAMEREKSPKKD